MHAALITKLGSLPSETVRSIVIYFSLLFWTLVSYLLSDRLDPEPVQCFRRLDPCEVFHGSGSVGMVPIHSVLVRYVLAGPLLRSLIKICFFLFSFYNFSSKWREECSIIFNIYFRKCFVATSTPCRTWHSGTMWSQPMRTSRTR